MEGPHTGSGDVACLPPDEVRTPHAWLPFLIRSLTSNKRPPQLVETRQSWLVVGQDEVFKIKKPLRTAWADWSSVTARERNALQEWRLNRRLAPDVYLGVLALVRIGQEGGQEGALNLLPRQQVRPFLANNPGTVLDWVVRMRRLPKARMLDRLIQAHALSLADLHALMDVLAHFYQSQPQSDLAPDAYVARFATELSYSRNLLAMPRFASLQALPLLDALNQALAEQTPALQRRASQHRLVDGHGDLRPEHVCMLTPPVVIDALEFSHTLRQVDPFDELVYLGLECALLGAPWVLAQLVARGEQIMQDWPGEPLIGFYGAARAVLRARMCASHLLDMPPRCPDKWLPLAHRYLVQAWQALEGREGLHRQFPRQAP